MGVWGIKQFILDSDNRNDYRDIILVLKLGVPISK